MLLDVGVQHVHVLSRFCSLCAAVSSLTLFLWWLVHSLDSICVWFFWCYAEVGTEKLGPHWFSGFINC